MDYRASELFGISSIEELQILLDANLNEYKSEKNIFWNHYFCKVIKGKRLIEAPGDNLKKLQRRIHCYLKVIDTPSYIHSCKGKSSITNASTHRNNITKIIKLDISKFFPSTSRDKVYKFWKNDMKMSGEVANIMTNITTISIPPRSKICNFLSEHGIETLNHLPTGCPTSSLLSFLVNAKMYEEIYQVVKDHDGIISIYADDITISGINMASEVYYKIRFILFSYGYRASNSKSHIETNKEKTNITGVIIRDGGKLLVPNKTNKKIKDVKTSTEGKEKQSSIIKGVKQYQKQINIANNEYSQRKAP